MPVRQEHAVSCKLYTVCFSKSTVDRPRSTVVTANFEVLRAAVGCKLCAVRFSVIHFLMSPPD